MFDLLLDFLFPRRSLTGKGGQWITPAERSRLKTYPVIEREEILRKRGLKFLDTLRAASAYRDCPLLKKAIQTFKYGRVRSLAGDLAALIDTVAPPLKDAVLCPVPLHWTRLVMRGFNQSELLADAVSARRRLPVQKLLKRVRSTGHQALRPGRSERFMAIEGAFRCTTKNVPACVILIDDLSTTGATLDACAKVLKETGVQKVEAWVVAHG
ncbi:TPA: ComF family protein [Candidatus Peribacteria bacterium]|nr:MAG: hypothetical protein A3J91_01125 [Candidatus Peribacteria bacterium RIFOXYC2_FULL_58_10]OGJ84725.1 MAG: hypothetical protein A2529_01050 [Candidatus Peribacteria bacterium RIFOXYD2_FULL_58_15]HAI98879.1 ComF family protein [Candidatus Peribacteria bacterium]HAS33723.1 ComF family protein [Candidatus Peribacteria bacterium]